MVDFICTDHQGLIVISNRVVSQLEISIVSIYVKNCNNIDTNDIQNTCLPQSKSYLKILSIPYIMKSFIKTSHIFDNINITSRPWVVKVSSKSNMAIVWINIWDSQNGLMAKKLINQYFNVGRFIATIKDANMNSSVSQCKNC